MIQSMTGFGSAERGAFRVEVRSLNHRFLDIAIKLPSALGKYDVALRDRIKKNFDRGRFDVHVSLTGEEKISLKVNSDTAREVLNALESLKKEFALAGDIGLENLMAWRDMLFVQEAEHDQEALLQALDDALAELKAMRQKEGQSTIEEIRTGTRKIGKLNDEVVGMIPTIIEEAKERFSEKVKMMLSEELCDNSKLIFEASKAAEKADINEEVSRIRAHVAHFEEIVSEGGRIGRKLDFLLQELYRESNTIASKSENDGIIKMAVEMKAEIETARELVQNLQ